jgi:predicted amidophosphoribosyltransferase
MSVGHWFAAAAQLVWPARCAACDAFIPDAAIFCASCDLSLGDLNGVCRGCALPFSEPANPDADPVRRCLRCHRVPFPFGQAHAVFSYGEAIAAAIVRMKHGGRRDLARRLGRLLAPALVDAIAAADLQPTDAVLPVPLHPRRLRQRGFNQALEIIRGAFAALPATALPAAARPRLEWDRLRRIRPTRELGHAGPAARLGEVSGAFAVDNPAAVDGRRILLVDDVFTTGATFSTCTDALRRAGARSVDVLALARAV